MLYLWTVNFLTIRTRKACRNLVGEDADVFAERIRRADVGTGQTDLTRSTSRQFAFLEDQSQQREQRMATQHRTLKTWGTQTDIMATV